MTVKQDKPYIIRVFSHLIRLPKYILYFEGKTAKFESLITNLQSDNNKLKDTVSNLQKMNSTINTIDERTTNLQHIISVLSKENKNKNQAISQTISDNHDYDIFYKKFEDKFRGSEELIKKRNLVHLPLFQKLPESLKKMPIFDLGCGRGEFLSIMSENNFNAIGIDMNEDMVKNVKNIGLNAIQDDALSYLSKQETNSCAAITGFHIIEHIPFEILMDIFSECFRVLSPGGFILFETPNPENLNVGACNFYIDPSHIKPIPPELLAFTLINSGFDTKIIRLHPAKKTTDHTDETIKDIMGMLYGPQDYAAVGYKL